MLDLKFIKDNEGLVRKAFKKRGLEINFDNLFKNSEKRNVLISQIEKLRSERNAVSKEIASLKKEGKNTESLIADMKDKGFEIESKENELSKVEQNISSFIAELPNLPDEDIVAGGKENNETLKVYGEKPNFDFKIKDHVELAKENELIDYERGVKLSGRGSWIYSNMGARLEWALLNYFIDEHIKDGYQFMLIPHILNYQCGFGAGQFPKFKEDVFMLDGLDEGKKNFLLPTAETGLVNIHSKEILDEDELPRKYFSYTPCYRKEIGSYRSEERGMIRGKQFNKVEMFQFVKPEKSDQAFEDLVAKAERLVEGLGLHYRTSKLAAGDISAGMARTYDIEVWIPSMNIYKEVSSVSNSRDYQPRRTQTKFKNSKTGKNEYIHMLNGSGLATSRLIPAILEQNQQKDGSIKVPEKLVKYLGVEVLAKK